MLFTLNAHNTTATQYLDTVCSYMAGVKFQYGDAMLLKFVCISQDLNKVEFAF